MLYVWDSEVFGDYVNGNIIAYGKDVEEARLNALGRYLVEYCGYCDQFDEFDIDNYNKFRAEIEKEPYEICKAFFAYGSS